MGGGVPPLPPIPYYHGHSCLQMKQATHLGTKPQIQRHERTQREFLDQARARLPAMLAADAEHGVRATFEVIADRIDGEEIARLLAVLPAELQALWPERHRDG